MKKRTLFGLLLGLVLCLTVMTTRASSEDIIIPEIRIECDVTSVTAGLLPAFHASTTTEHATIEAYGLNTAWAQNNGSVWYGFGLDEEVAVNDGTTHYGLRLCVEIDDGYKLSESTKIILNGVERNDKWNKIRLYPWGGYVTIDLGLAVGYGGAGWYMNEDDGILHLNGPVTNPSTKGVDQSPWQEYKSKIKSVVCDPGASIDSGARLFTFCPNLTKADLRGLDTSGVKDLYGMFGLCVGLAEVDFTGLDTSAVESVESMFAFCPNLHTLDWKECDLSHVTNAADLFTYSGLVRVTAGSKTLSGIADAMIAHEPGWRDINSGAVYSTASGLKAVTGTVTLEPFGGLAIPGGTQRIEAEAFQGIDASTVVIPNGCQYIGSQAFADCANLTKVYIPSSVQTILSDAFVRCPHITVYTPTGSRAAQWCGVTGVPCVEY